MSTITSDNLAPPDAGDRERAAGVLRRLAAMGGNAYRAIARTLLPGLMRLRPGPYTAEELRQCRELLDTAEQTYASPHALEPVSAVLLRQHERRREAFQAGFTAGVGRQRVTANPYGEDEPFEADAWSEGWWAGQGH